MPATRTCGRHLCLPLTLRHGRRLRKRAAKDKLWLVNAGAGRVKRSVAYHTAFRALKPLAYRKCRNRHNGLTSRISDPAPNTFDLERRRNRGVHWIRFVGLTHFPDPFTLTIVKGHPELGLFVPPSVACTAVSLGAVSKRNTLSVRPMSNHQSIANRISLSSNVWINMVRRVPGSIA